MPKLKELFIRHLARRAVKKGANKLKVIEYYSLFIDEARKEFDETSRPCIDNFLVKCHHEAMNND